MIRVSPADLVAGDIVNVCGQELEVAIRIPSPSSPTYSIVGFVGDDDTHVVHNSGGYNLVHRARPLTAAEADLMFAAIDEAHAIEADR